MFLPMAMFFYILFYVSMPFNEERTEFKKMQPISPFIYWTSVFLFDATIHFLYSYFMYTTHIWLDSHNVFEDNEYSNRPFPPKMLINHWNNVKLYSFLLSNVVMFGAIYLLYGLAYLPIIYMISQLFRTMSSIYSFLTYLFVIFCKY